jgi:hypothetical protein
MTSPHVITAGEGSLIHVEGPGFGVTRTLDDASVRLKFVVGFRQLSPTVRQRHFSFACMVKYVARD